MTITIEYVELRLRKSCVPSPVTLGKLVREFGAEPRILEQAINLFMRGALQTYKMIPGNGNMEF